jgi:hypothetical protein
MAVETGTYTNGRRNGKSAAAFRTISEVLYADGYTIKGVQKLLRDGSVKPSQPDATDAVEAEEVEHTVAADSENSAESAGLSPQTRNELSEVLNELVVLKKKLTDVRR